MTIIQLKELLDIEISKGNGNLEAVIEVSDDNSDTFISTVERLKEVNFKRVEYPNGKLEVISKKALFLTL